VRRRFAQSAAVWFCISLLGGTLLWFAAPQAPSPETLFFGCWLLSALGPFSILVALFRGAMRITGPGFVLFAILFIVWVRSPAWTLRRHVLASIAWCAVGSCIGLVLLWSTQ
jgi:hypothetical protein